MPSATETPPDELSGDALAGRTDHPIRLPVFEGPLDLLLYLIRKNEIDIHDIPIGTVMRQYLEVLRGYERMNLDVAGEFFVMAATLMYIKSRMLLPPEKVAAGETGDEEAAEQEENLDPRWQLVRQLIQYKRIKESAGYLHALIEARQGFAQRVVPPPSQESDERPVAGADRIEIWNTFNEILRRLSQRAMPGEIHAESVTITTRMEDILSRLSREPSFTFTSLLPERPTIPFLVATFLACLELARLGKLMLDQTGNFDDILCRERPADDPLFLHSDAPADAESAPPSEPTEEPHEEAEFMDDEDDDDFEEDDESLEEDHEAPPVKDDPTSPEESRPL